MRLSEAMRRGIAKRPRQAFRAFLGRNGGSCATGAALEGMGFRLRQGRDGEVQTMAEYGSSIHFKEHSYFFKDHGIPKECPACGCRVKVNGEEGFASLIVHLNNCHWTREHIADWVESHENRILEKRAK